METNSSAVVGPGYIAPEAIPHAADIFYFRDVHYTVPTGFMPIERSNVCEFPRYCREKGVSLPRVYWEMFGQYYDNDRLALDCAELLEPLTKVGKISFDRMLYERDRKTIQQAAKFVAENPGLLRLIMACPISFRFVSREVVSHAVSGIDPNRGVSFDFLIRYLSRYSSRRKLIELTASVLVHRLEVFMQLERSPFDEVLLFEEGQRRVIAEIKKLRLPKDDKNDPKSSELHLRYRIFGTLLEPIYGKCDSRKKNSIIASLSKDKASEIESLKEECLFLATDLLSRNIQEEETLRRLLTQLIADRIVRPLGEFTSKSQAETRRLLTDFVLSSGIVTAILSSIIEPNPSTVSLAIAAGGISALAKDLLNSGFEPSPPTRFLLASLKKMKVKERDYIVRLQALTSSATLPL